MHNHNHNTQPNHRRGESISKKRVTPGAYGILCLQNRKYYIGSSGDIEIRIADHLAKLRTNRLRDLPRLQKDWNRFGESAFTIARFPCPHQYRKDLEQQLIASLQTLEHQQGYNKMCGDKWGIEASIRNTETKLMRSRKFSFLPELDIETPMLQIYITTFCRSQNGYQLRNDQAF